MGGRVVVLDHTGERGGAEIALQRLLEALDGEWDVSVILFSDGPFRESLEHAGIATEVLEMPRRTAAQSRSRLTDPRVIAGSATDSFTFAQRLATRLQARGPNLVVANSLKAAVLSELSSWRTGFPWVWHLHDRIAPDYLPAPVVVGLRQLARRATHVVANSQAVAKLINLAPRKVTIAYPGLPDDSFADVHVAPSPPVFGLLGRISSTKGQGEFVRAAAIVSRDHPEVRFRVVGEALFSDHQYAAEVKQLATDLGIEDRIEWTGWARDPRLAIDEFTALVHASPVPEPFGQVIVEAMARGVPVVATVGGGVGEILHASSATGLRAGSVLTTDRGRLVGARDTAGLANAMKLVLSQPAETQSLAITALRDAREQFSVAATAANCTVAWQTALAKPSRGWWRAPRERTSPD